MSIGKFLKLLRERDFLFEKEVHEHVGKYFSDEVYSKKTSKYSRKYDLIYNLLLSEDFTDMDILREIGNIVDIDIDIK